MTDPADRPGARLPAPLILADELRALGAVFEVVGSSATWRPGRPEPRDLDVLLAPTDEALDQLAAALDDLGARSRTRRPRTATELAAYCPWQLWTDRGGLDIFVTAR